MVAQDRGSCADRRLSYQNGGLEPRGNRFGWRRPGWTWMPRARYGAGVTGILHRRLISMVAAYAVVLQPARSNARSRAPG
jgi:hypothetical protein